MSAAQFGASAQHGAQGLEFGFGPPVVGASGAHPVLPPTAAASAPNLEFFGGGQMAGAVGAGGGGGGGGGGGVATGFEGAMGSGAMNYRGALGAIGGGGVGGGGGSSGPRMYAPAPSFESSGGSSGSIAAGGVYNSFEDEPPLLEELGINFDHIRAKTQAVLHPGRSIPAHMMDDADLAGPLVFCLALGFCLLLTGKVHFGYIYGFGIVGCVLMFSILNLMSADEGIDLHRTTSILGYCLLPIVLLAALNVIFNLRGTVGGALTLIAIAWCTHTATRFFETALDMREQRYLIAYPVFLLFSCFALITVF
jgi:hypothetical protein